MKNTGLRTYQFAGKQVPRSAFFPGIVAARRRSKKRPSRTDRLRVGQGKNRDYVDAHRNRWHWYDGDRSRRCMA